jgi:hypothetical protein
MITIQDLLNDYTTEVMKIHNADEDDYPTGEDKDNAIEGEKENLIEAIEDLLTNIIS